jgi:hypothetical protein
MASHRAERVARVQRVTSIIYSAAAFARHGPAERDTRGMALSTAWMNPGSV